MSLFLAMMLTAAGPHSTPARRCGWLVNPTPANWSLIDRDGEWELGAQGGWQASGLDDMPDMTSRGWVQTNGTYGHGCACLDVTVDRGRRRPGSPPLAAPGAASRRRVPRLFGARPMPLRACRADHRLPRF